MRETAETRAIQSFRRTLAVVRLALGRTPALPGSKAYDPSQPRVPRGNPEGGEWTDDERWVRVAQAGGGAEDAFPAYQAAAAREQEARARELVQRVQSVDRRWQPPPGPGSNGSAAERLAHGQAVQRAAEARYGELQRMGMVPGRFAAESLSARGPERNFTRAERAEINRIGSTTGCHTCGTLDPRTGSGNFYVDHQRPNAINPTSAPQRLFPHCRSCSNSQGGLLPTLMPRF